MAGEVTIKSLEVQGFRGVESLKWTPSNGVNIILGGGDAGKSTILDAIALLLSPTNSTVLNEADFWNKKTENGFLIKAFFSLPASTDINQQRALSWPWEWTGSEAIAPKLNEDGDDVVEATKPVYCLQVRGTPDLELIWEIVQPNEEVSSLTSSLRRDIGLIRLSSEDRNDRDLRLVYGSALDRLLSDPSLRARIGQSVANINLQDKLSDEAKKSLASLDEALKSESLPHTLDIGVTSAQGFSIGALVGLLAQKNEEIALPLSSWGAGTRRMVTLQIAAQTQQSTRITVIDELERGLEPYRARKLITALEKEQAQSFVTTHSAEVVSAATGSQLWFLDSKGNIGELNHKKIKAHQSQQPLTFLSRYAIICEGKTEVGLMSLLLEKAIEGHYHEQGVYLADGGGNRTTLDLLEALSEAGIYCAGFADDEGDAPDRWASLKTSMGDTLLKWQDGNTETNIISNIAEENLEALIEDGDGGKAGIRRRHLADRLGIENKDMESIREALNQANKSLNTLIIEAAGGSSEGAPDDLTKEWKKHGQQWFKTHKGGRELAEKMFLLGAWPSLSDQILPLLNAVRAILGQNPLDTLTHE